MKNIITILLNILLYTNAFAHQGMISGKIIAASTNTEIENANIYIQGIGKELLSDAHGSFCINGLNQGKYKIAVSHIGFITDTQTVTIKDYEKTTIVFKLKTMRTAIQEITISKIPNLSSSVFNNINFQRMPINNTQDILKTVPGLFIAQHAGGGKAEQIFLRGFDCDHGTDIAIHVDGMPVNMVSHAHGQGYADLHFVIPEMVEKIEVTKGSYEAKNGDFSTAGAIAFTTKSYFDKNLIQLEKGMFNNNRALAMINILGNKKSNNWIAAAEYNFNKGYFDSPMNLNRLNFITKYHHTINDKHQLNIQASYFNSFWDASGQIPNRLVENNTITPFGSVDPTEGGQTSRSNMSATLTSFAKNEAIIKNQFFYNTYRFNLYSNFTFYKNDSINGDMIQQKENRKIYGYNGTFEKTNRFNNNKLNTKAGLQIRYDDILGSELSNVKQRHTFIRAIALGDTKQLNASAFIDEQINIGKKWSLYTGTRFDNIYFYHNDVLNNSKLVERKSIWSPKASIYYTANNKTQFFIKVGKGFHSNDTRVVTAQRGHQVLPASYGADFGTIIKANKNLLINAAFWQLDLQQEFVYVGDEAVVEASGASRRLGLDVSARYQVAKHLTADADLNFSYARMKDEPIEVNRIPLAPIFTSIGGLSYNNKKWDASLRYRYLGNRAANEMNTLVADGYFLMDAVASYTLKKFIFGFSAENLLNNQWKEAQFETETKLKNEMEPVSEIHYTSGTPFNIKFKIGYSF